MSDLRNEVECSTCGRDGGPYAGCGTCHGNAQVQSKGYTLSEHRTGRAPHENRYDPEGGLNPKTSPLVIGGAVNHPSHRQN